MGLRRRHGCGRPPGDLRPCKGISRVWRLTVATSRPWCSGPGFEVDCCLWRQCARAHKPKGLRRAVWPMLARILRATQCKKFLDDLFKEIHTSGKLRGSNGFGVGTESLSFPDNRNLEEWLHYSRPDITSLINLDFLHHRTLHDCTTWLEAQIECLD